MREPRIALVVFLFLALAACPTSPPPTPPQPGVTTGPSPWPQVPQVPQVPPIPQVGPVPAPPIPPPAPGGGQITIAPGTGGGISVQGAPPLHGDPASCAAFQACCAPHQGQLSPAGLACGLTPAASNGDCAQSLQAIRGIFREQNIALPAGCGP